MAQIKAELEYDKFKALTAGDARAVDAYFDHAADKLQKLPRPKTRKPTKR